MRSLCEIGGDCFGPRYFSEGAQLPKKNTEVQNNHRQIRTMTETKMVQSYYCLNRLEFHDVFIGAWKLCFNEKWLLKNAEIAVFVRTIKLYKNYSVE